MLILRGYICWQNLWRLIHELNVSHFEWPVMNWCKPNEVVSLIEVLGVFSTLTVKDMHIFSEKNSGKQKLVSAEYISEKTSQIQILNVKSFKNENQKFCIINFFFGIFYLTFRN